MKIQYIVLTTAIGLTLLTGYAIAQTENQSIPPIITIPLNEIGNTKLGKVYTFNYVNEITQNIVTCIILNTSASMTCIEN